MARRQRLDRPGAWHHVMNRGAGRRAIFRSDADRRAMVALVAELEERFAVEVHAFCLMGNHYHLLVRSREGRLSEAMQWLGSVFTRHANWARSVDGPIFRGRFHSVPADDALHRFVLGSYIHANPVDLGWDVPLVDYPWSSLSSYAGVVEREWLVQAELLHLAQGSQGVVFAAEQRRLDEPVQQIGPIEFEVARRTLEVFSGVTGQLPSSSVLDSLAIAMLVDVAGSDRRQVQLASAQTPGGFRVALSRGRRAAVGPLRPVTAAATTALQLVSDTSCNGRLLRHV